jgi:hypothetical protein
MDTKTTHRPTRLRLTLFGLAASAALVLPTVPASATVDELPTANAGAIWAVMRSLPLAEVEVLHAGLHPIVQQEITDMINAVAGSLSW